jgi:c-di-AMP phosphodiesterase-like protein
MINKEDISKITIRAGEQNREWQVENIEDESYAVHYLDKNKASQLVDISLDISCNCTYREYNQTCPHIQAVQKFRDIIDATENSGRSEMDKVARDYMKKEFYDNGGDSI